MLFQMGGPHLETRAILSFLNTFKSTYISTFIMTLEIFKKKLTNILGTNYPCKTKTGGGGCCHFWRRLGGEGNNF